MYDNETRPIRRALRQQIDGLRAWGLTEIPTMPKQPTPAAPSTARPRATAEKITALRALEREVKDCTSCPLYKTRTNPVFGEGDPDARLVFVGEAPGRDEDLQGRPFVSAAGQLLTKMIEAMGLKREQVYICNVLKNRPPDNRAPLPDEVAACLPFLTKQLEIIQPALICALGAVATKALLGPGASITALRGRVQWCGSTPVVPTFHPAYLLRNPDAKKPVWQDLKTVMKLLADPGSLNAGATARMRSAA